MAIRPRAALAALLSFTVAATISGCVPGGGEDDVAQGLDLVSSFAALGIATTPFEGGEPVEAVTGTPVLALTDWQVGQMERSFPVFGENGMKTATGGISLDDLDAALLAMGSDPGQGFLSPRTILLSWWGAADSPRAEFARQLIPAPLVSSGIVVPEAISTLFLADALTDFARPDAGVTAAAAGPRVFALGDGVPADPCGSIQKAVDGVNQFLADAGPLGTIMKTALGKAAGAADTATGGLGTALQKVIMVLNVALSIASLLTHWDVRWSHLPNTRLLAGQNGEVGQIGSVTVRVDNPAGKVPGPVSSCLTLLGIIDPSSQKGAAVTSIVHIGIAPDAQFVQGLITQDVSPLPTELDADNEANFNVAAGTQIYDTTQKSKNAYGTGSIEVHIERADVKRLTDFLLSLNSSYVQSVLGTTLPELAESTLLLSQVAGTEDVGVQYLVPDKAPPPPVPLAEFEWDDGPAENRSLPPEGECVDPWRVEYITRQQVTEHWTQAAASDLDACVYRLANGNRLGYTPFETYPPDEAIYLDIGYQGLLPKGDCYNSGLLEGISDLDGDGNFDHDFIEGESELTYFVWTGNAIASVGVSALWGPYPTNYLAWTRGLAAEAGLCPVGALPDQTPGEFDDHTY